MIAFDDDLGHETRRGIAFERIFRIAQVLKGRRFAIHLDDLTREISEQTEHGWHKRTIRRDINLLEYLGCVELVDARARWINPADLLSQQPERVRDAADLVALQSNGGLPMAPDAA